MRVLAAATACVATLLVCASTAVAFPLYVDAPEHAGFAWRSGDFRLYWTPPPNAGSVVRLVVDGQEQPFVQFSPGAIGKPAQISPFRPSEPGAHSAFVVYENDGRTSEPTLLLFDDAAPQPPRLKVPPGWIGDGVGVAVEVLPAPGAAPVSGIAGYAVALSRGPAVPPCAAPSCAAGELRLPGPNGGPVEFGGVPGGVYTLSAAAVSGAAVPSAASTATLRVDPTRPEIAIAGAPFGWSQGPVRVRVGATDPLSGMEPNGALGPFTAVAIDGELAVREPGGSAEATVSGDGVHLVSTVARDAAGNQRGGTDPHPGAAATVRIDGSAPSVAFVTRLDPAEPELIEAVVRDRLSGPSPSRGTIAIRAAGSRAPFEPLPTTVAAGVLRAHWDSDAYPRGPYEFRAVGFDLAGNSAAGELRGDGTPMVLVNPVKVPTAAALGFGGARLVWHRCVRRDERRRCEREVIAPLERRPSRRVVPYGRPVRVSGRLRTAAGAPLTGRAVTLVESFDPGARPRRRVTKLRTSPLGGFVAALAPGPSRRLELHYEGDRLLTRASSESLRLAVLTAVRLRASSPRADVGGAPVVFSGKVGGLGAEIPVYGRPVQMEYRLAGGEWTEFRTVQTDGLGRFRLPYEFSDDDSRGVRFNFRAVAPAQPNWPYVPGVSRPVAVTGG